MISITLVTKITRNSLSPTYFHVSLNSSIACSQSSSLYVNHMINTGLVFEKNADIYTNMAVIVLPEPVGMCKRQLIVHYLNKS